MKFVQKVFLPVNKGSLGIHLVKLDVQSVPCVLDGCCVGKAAHGLVDLCKVSTRYNSWGLVVDSDFESCGTPVDKLHFGIGFHGANGGIDILGDDIPPVEETTGHVLASMGITFHHLVFWIKTCSCYLLS